jgi:hypothetical protein
MRGAYDMVQPSTGSTVAFLAIVFALCGLLLAGVARAGRTLGEAPALTRRWLLGTLLGIVLVLGVTAAAMLSHVLEKPVTPPLLMPFVASALLLAVVLAFSSFGTRLVRGLPIAVLVGFQAFRLPLELVLHAWYAQGVLPVQMTFEGHNFDIVSGVLALVVGLLLGSGRAPRGVVWLFNLVGSALLCAVTVIAVTSAPVPFRQYLNDPPLLLPYHFPYGWIAHVCVGGALFGHLLVFRWLARPRSVRAM